MIAKVFIEWFNTIYLRGNYTESYKIQVAPYIVTSKAAIVGPCAPDPSPGPMVTTLLPTLENVGDSVSDASILLAIVVPTVAVACACLLLATICCIMYRRRRYERKFIPSDSKDIFLKHQPTILPGELESVPYRSKKPTILPNELLQPRGYRAILHEHDIPPEDILAEDDTESESDEELVDLPAVNLLLPQDSPPKYKLPPRYVLT